MKRFHDPKEERIMNRELGRRRSLVGHCETKRENQKGRYRKKDAYDCGKPGCKMCHGDKIWDQKTIKDEKSEFVFKEQLREAS